LHIAAISLFGLLEGGRTQTVVQLWELPTAASLVLVFDEAPNEKDAAILKKSWSEFDWQARRQAVELEVNNLNARELSPHDNKKRGLGRSAGVQHNAFVDNF
jgi:Rad3-related DNA helicase